MLFFLIILLTGVFSWSAPPLFAVQAGDSVVLWLTVPAHKWDAALGKDTISVRVEDQTSLPQVFRNAILVSNITEARKMGVLRTMRGNQPLSYRIDEGDWNSIIPVKSLGPILADPALSPTPSDSGILFQFRLRFESGFPTILTQAKVKLEKGAECPTVCAADSNALVCRATCKDSPSQLLTFMIQPTLLGQWKWPEITYAPIQWNREPLPTLSAQKDSTGVWVVNAKGPFSNRVSIDSLHISLQFEGTDSVWIDTVVRGAKQVQWRIAESRLPWNQNLQWKASWHSHGVERKAPSIDWIQQLPADAWPQISPQGIRAGNRVLAQIRSNPITNKRIGLKAFRIQDSITIPVSDSVKVLFQESGEGQPLRFCMELAQKQLLCNPLSISFPEWKKAEVSSLQSSEGVSTVRVTLRLQDSTLLPWISQYQVIDQCPGKAPQVKKQFSRDSSSFIWARSDSLQCLKLIPEQRKSRPGFSASLLLIQPRTLFHEHRAGQVSVTRNHQPGRWNQMLEWKPNAHVHTLVGQWMDSKKNTIGSFRWEKSSGTRRAFGIVTEPGQDYFLRITGMKGKTKEEQEGPADTIRIHHPWNSIPMAQISRWEYTKDSMTVNWNYPKQYQSDIKGYRLLLNGNMIRYVNNPLDSFTKVPIPPAGIYALELSPDPLYLPASPGGEPRSLVLSYQPVFRFCPGEPAPPSTSPLWRNLEHAWRLLSDTLALATPYSSSQLCPGQADVEPFPPARLVMLSRKLPFQATQTRLGYLVGDAQKFLLALHPNAADSTLSDIASHELAHAFFYHYRIHYSQLIPWEEALATWVQWRIGLKGPYQQPDPSKIKDFPSFEKVSPMHSYPYWVRFKEKSDQEIRKIITGK